MTDKHQADVSIDLKDHSRSPCILIVYRSIHTTNIKGARDGSAYDIVAVPCLVSHAVEWSTLPIYCSPCVTDKSVA